jgi:hypothetical protein
VTGVTCTDGEQGWRVSRPAADGTVTIVNPTSGRCLDTADGATAQYSALVIGDCVPSSTTQRWRMGTATPATQQLQQQASQLCATGNDGYALGDCATASGFTALTSADGTGVILSRGDGRCLTVRGALTGSLVATDLCTDGDPVSAWTQIPSGAGDGSVMLRNQSDNECLDTRYAETAAGSRLVQGPCVVGSATQRWTLR